MYPLFANDRATFFVFCGGTQDATLPAPEMDCAPDQLTRIHVDASRERQEPHVPQWAQLDPIRDTCCNFRALALDQSRAQYARPKQEISQQLSNFFAQHYKERRERGTGRRCGDELVENNDAAAVLIVVVGIPVAFVLLMVIARSLSPQLPTVFYVSLLTYFYLHWNEGKE